MKALFLLLAVVPGLVLAQGTPRIIETFQVGPTVYVRASRWSRHAARLVGTSAGLNEVDLESGKLRSTFTRRDGPRASRCSRSRSTRRATSGSARGPAALRGTVMVHSRRISRCTGWPTTACSRSRRMRAARCGWARARAASSFERQVHHLREAAGERVGLRPRRGPERAGGSPPRAACRCSTARPGGSTQADRPGAPRTERGNRIPVHAGKTARSGPAPGAARRASTARWTSLTPRTARRQHRLQHRAGGRRHALVRHRCGPVVVRRKEIEEPRAEGGPAGAERVCAAAAPKGEVWAGARGAVVRLARR